VSVKFLSQEWADQLSAALNGNEAFAKAAASQRAKLQQVIAGPDGEIRYWISIEDAVIAMGLGDLEGPDATITQSYETAVKLAKRELSPVTGFMTGKIKIGGNMGLLLGLQNVLALLPDAMASFEVEY